jgi:hypothetical protein
MHDLIGEFIMKPSYRRALLAVAVGLLFSTAVRAAEPAILMAPQSQNGITFVTGGIGEEQKQALLAVRHEYNLLLTFANKVSGEYRADVTLCIQNAKGAQVLGATSVGPLLYAKLPAGTYQVTAIALGKPLVRSIAVRKDGVHELVFYWEGEKPN